MKPLAYSNKAKQTALVISATHESVDIARQGAGGVAVSSVTRAEFDANWKASLLPVEPILLRMIDAAIGAGCNREIIGKLRDAETALCNNDEPAQLPEISKPSSPATDSSATSQRANGNRLRQRTGDVVVTQEPDIPPDAIKPPTVVDQINKIDDKIVFFELAKAIHGTEKVFDVKSYRQHQIMASQLLSWLPGLSVDVENDCAIVRIVRTPHTFIANSVPAAIAKAQIYRLRK